MAKLTEVKETKKSSKSKIDLKKIKKVIDDNPEAVRKIKEGVTDIITAKMVSDTKKKVTGKKKTTSKKSDSSDSLSKVMDLAGSLLKK